MRNKGKILMVVLAIIMVIFMFGCREINQLKEMATRIEGTYLGLGVYDGEKLILFIVNEATNCIYFDIWYAKSDNKNDRWSVCTEKGQLGGAKYTFTSTYFIPVKWSEGGIVGRYPPGIYFNLPEEISKREFSKAVKPFIKVLLEKGVDVTTAQKPLARELGLIEQGTRI